MKMGVLRYVQRPDILFFLLVLGTSSAAFLVPFLYYSTDESNPWPYAYEVIQSQIIASGQFKNLIPQLGSFQPFDYGWFAVHHLNLVVLRLLSALPYASIERLLTFFLAVLFFCGFYLFARRAFGNPTALASSLFFLLVPRTYNYLVNVNGELIGWVILFPALAAFFLYARKRQVGFGVLSCVMGSSLVITNLMVFLQYLVIVGSYVAARTILARDTKLLVFKFLPILVLMILLIPIPVLVTSGNLIPGSSSTIGSLFASRNPVEAHYEQVYYQKYEWYWTEFAAQLPLLVQANYISDDGIFLNFVLLAFVPLAILGIAACIHRWRQVENLFVLIWFAVTTFLSSFFLSSLFNDTIIAGSIRLLLYFGWPLAVLAGVGAVFLWRHARLPSIRIFSKRVSSKHIVGGILLAVLTIEGVQIGATSANYANAYPALYAKEYQDAMKWLRNNTPSNAVIITNDWTGGEIWVNSQRLSLTESGKGSAAYSTYQDVVTILDDARTILTTQSVTETVALMGKYNVQWIVVWNRPSAYYIASPDEVAYTKFESYPIFETVFDESQIYGGPFYTPYKGGFQAHAAIYHVKVIAQPYPEFVSHGLGSRVGYTNGSYVASYMVTDLQLDKSPTSYTFSRLFALTKRIGTPSNNTLDILVNGHIVALDVSNTATNWNWSSWAFSAAYLAQSNNITFLLQPQWDSRNQVVFGTFQGSARSFTMYSISDRQWIDWQGVELSIFLELQPQVT